MGNNAERAEIYAQEFPVRDGAIAATFGRPKVAVYRFKCLYPTR